MSDLEDYREAWQAQNGSLTAGHAWSCCHVRINHGK